MSLTLDVHRDPNIDVGIAGVGVNRDGGGDNHR